MIHNERTRDVDATPEEVWAVLGRFMHIDAFAPSVVSVDALTDDEEGIGSTRRCHFKDGNSVVEEVVEWTTDRQYRVRLSEVKGMPLDEAYGELSVEPLGNGRSRTKMAMDYRVKFGPIGWLMGQTMMKMMMGKIFDEVLKGLDDKVRTDRAATVPGQASAEAGFGTAPRTGQSATSPSPTS